LVRRLSVHSIDKAVLASDATRPPSYEIVFQGLGFADPLERSAACVFDEIVNSLEYFWISLLPVEITKRVSVDAESTTPLLWVIRDHVGLTGTKYGCGAGLCGACTVHVDGTAVRSCSVDLKSVEGKKVVTIEGLSASSTHPLQKAWIAEEVPQCGYCQSGQIMKAAELLAKTPNPSRADIITHMDGNICRCGTYHRIIAAIERASKEA